MDEREILRGRSPEELQYRTRQAFESMPAGQSLTTYLDEVNPSREEFRDDMERRASAESEISPILLKKFGALIEQSPTTPSFRTAMHYVIDLTLQEGRVMEGEEDFDNGRTDTLLEVLQLDTSTGMYLTEGAKNAESALYDFICGDFSDGIFNIISEGLNPLDPNSKTFGTVFKHLSIGEYRDFILNWYREFTQNYGVELDAFSPS